MSPARMGVVVVHWRAMPELLECLASLAPEAQRGVPIVIALNGSPDFDVTVAEAACPGVTTAVSLQNLGYAGGCNLGARALGGDVEAILFLNNDVVVPPGLIDALSTAFEQEPSVGVAGVPVVYYKDPSRVWAIGGTINRFFGFTRHAGFDEAALPEAGIDVDYVNGSAIAVRSKVLDAIGGWDESYFHFWDEADLCDRARAAGQRVHVIPGPAVPHKVSASTGIRGSARFNRAQACYFVRNRILFMRRRIGWPQRLSALAAQPLLLAYECTKALLKGDWEETRGRLEGFAAGVLGHSGERRGGW